MMWGRTSPESVRPARSSLSRVFGPSPSREAISLGRARLGGGSAQDKRWGVVMLGEVLCIRPRPSIAASVSFPLANRLGPGWPVSPSAGQSGRSHHHSSACSGGGGAASIWHVITPSGGGGGTGGIPRGARPARMREEGSWNAAWDVRPARWLHGPDSAWMLFGVCPCFELSHGCGNPSAGPEVEVEVEVEVEEVESRALLVVDGETKDDGASYRVTGED